MTRKILSSKSWCNLSRLFRMGFKWAIMVCWWQRRNMKNVYKTKNEKLTTTGISSHSQHHLSRLSVLFTTFARLTAARPARYSTVAATTRVYRSFSVDSPHSAFANISFLSAFFPSHFLYTLHMLRLCLGEWRRWRNERNLNQASSRSFLCCSSEFIIIFTQVLLISHFEFAIFFSFSFKFEILEVHERRRP